MIQCEICQRECETTRGFHLHMNRMHIKPDFTREERFFAKIMFLDNGCWLWTASLRDGYAAWWDGARHRYGHHWSYENFVGPVPEGLQLDHFLYPRTCIGPACVNFEHVRPVTARENTYRSDSIPAWHLAKTFCVHGHELTPDNTRLRPTGGRECRPCRREIMTNQQVRLPVPSPRR